MSTASRMWSGRQTSPSAIWNTQGSTAAGACSAAVLLRLVDIVARAGCHVHSASMCMPMVRSCAQPFGCRSPWGEILCTGVPWGLGWVCSVTIITLCHRTASFVPGIDTAGCQGCIIHMRLTLPRVLLSPPVFLLQG